jgi:penicillin-binding protein 2
MHRQFALRDIEREQKIVSRRLSVSVVFVIVSFLFLIAGAAYLQIIKGQHFSTLARENQVKVVPLAPNRGLIYSQDGIVLAENRPSFSLELVPELTPDIDATLRDLRSLIVISASDEERFRQEMQRKRRFEKVPIRFNLSEPEVARIAVNRYRFPGVDIEARLIRYYPYTNIAAHVTGYVGRIDEPELKSIDASNYSATTHIGKTGVEKSYEAALHGQVGYQQVEVDAFGRVIRVLERTPPVPGKDVYLTLDMRLQKIAYKALGDRRGAVVALDPNTGDVLALVSSPGFDPNRFVNGIEPSEYANLANRSDRPLFNRALQGQYPPGSTIKPFLALAGLSSGVRTPDQVSWCPGWYMLSGDDHKYRDWKRIGHGRMDMKLAIGESCDVYFYELAYELGIDRIYEFLVDFGFGGQTGIDLPGEVSGLVPSRDWKRKNMDLPWFPGETLISGIGQGFNLVTPIQLASATGMLSKRGVKFVPRIVERIEDPVHGDQVKIEPMESRVTADISSANWDTVIGAMEYVVHGATGTAHRISIGSEYRFAGKTGTAQLFGLEQDDEEADEVSEVHDHLKDHALFVAFAPVEGPLLAVAIIVENGGSGSAAAAPIARKLFDAYLRTPMDALSVLDHG